MCIHIYLNKHKFKIMTLFYTVSYPSKGIYTHITLYMAKNDLLYGAIGQRHNSGTKKCSIQCQLKCNAINR